MSRQRDVKAHQLFTCQGSALNFRIFSNIRKFSDSQQESQKTRPAKDGFFVARVERDDRAVSIETGSVGEVRRALENLEAAGVAVESLSLHKPTLDDVSLKLTGHEAEDKKTRTV